MERIEPHLPTDVRGVERAEDRRVISGILHVLKSGCRWCDCPPEYGPPTAIYNRFVRCARRGIWENLFRELAGCGRSADTQMTNSTHVKAARSNSAPNQPSASRPGKPPRDTDESGVEFSRPISRDLDPLVTAGVKIDINHDDGGSSRPSGLRRPLGDIGHCIRHGKLRLRRTRSKVGRVRSKALI